MYSNSRTIDIIDSVIFDNRQNNSYRSLEELINYLNYYIKLIN